MSKKNGVVGPSPKASKSARMTTERMVEFIKVWNDSSHVSEVSRKMGIPVGTCYVYAKRARKAGVGVKELVSRASIDWASVLASSDVTSVVASAGGAQSN